MPKPPRIELKKENLEALGSAPELQDRRAAPSEHSVMTLGTTMSEIVNQFGPAPGAPDVEAEWLARGDEELKVLKARECATLIADRVSRAHPACLCTANDVLLASMRHLQGLPEQAFRTSIESIGLLEATLIPEDLQAPAKKPCVEEQEPAGEEGSGEPPAENPEATSSSGIRPGNLEVP